MLSVQLFTPAHSITVSALVASGSSGNFISQDLLSHLHLPRRRHAQELRVETIQEKPLGSGHVRYEAPPLRIKIGNLHEEEITFLVLEGPTVGIILGPPGSSSTLQRSDGTPARWFAGANFATKTVLLNFHVYSTRHWPSRLPPHKLSPVLLPPSHLIMWRSRMSSASRQPPNFYPIGHGTLPSTCCLETNSRRVEYIRCPSRSARLWRSTWRRLLTKDPFDHPAHWLPQVSSSWVRRTGACSPVLTTVLLTHRRSNSLIYFSWSLPLSRNSVGHVSSPSWTCRARITLLESEKVMNGRRPSLPLPATMNISLCRMAPSVFQEFMNEVFREFLHSFVIVYIDDIFIYSRNLVDHRHHVRQVLHLYLKLEKCEFHHSTVQFLGYIIGQ